LTYWKVSSAVNYNHEEKKFNDALAACGLVQSILTTEELITHMEKDTKTMHNVSFFSP
jgi:hypothetical protein